MKAHPTSPYQPHLGSHSRIKLSPPSDCRQRTTMPRYTVHVRGEWLAVPCQDAQLTVGWLGREAVRRYIKNKPDNGGFASVDNVSFLVRRCKGLGLLDHEDPLEVALEDNEFVEVGEWPEGRGANHSAGRDGPLSSPIVGGAGTGKGFSHTPVRKAGVLSTFYNEAADSERRRLLTSSKD